MNSPVTNGPWSATGTSDPDSSSGDPAPRKLFENAEGSVSSGINPDCAGMAISPGRAKLPFAILTVERRLMNKNVKRVGLDAFSFRADALINT